MISNVKLQFWPKPWNLWLAEPCSWGHAVSLKGHRWRSEVIQHFPKGGVNQKHAGGETGWPLSHCARQRRRERDFPWHWGANTIPSLSKWHIASGGSHTHVTLCLCVDKCCDFYLAESLAPVSLTWPLSSTGNQTIFVIMQTLLRFVPCAPRLHQSLVVWELSVEGQPTAVKRGR